MRGAPFSRQAARRGDGSALLIVLFFMVLLTALTIAFLSRSMTARSVSSSSAGEARAGLLADSACEIIVGDLRQEIIAGSTNISSNPSYPVYIPVSNLTMVPFRCGVPTGTFTAAAPDIPNLVKRSVRPSNTSGASPYVPFTSTYSGTSTPINRAADDTVNPSKVSTTTASLNGRSISLARWNSHFLIPRASPDASATATPKSVASTPASTFVAPDWVIVTRSGANSVTWSTALSNSLPTNSSYAVGRYAYAIYNEGGLLDVNAAGYPNNLTTTQSSKKGSLALADLTQLPISASNVAAALSAAQVNNLVGWRNYASAGLTSSTGSFGAVSFTGTTTASNWLSNFATNNPSSFLTIVTPSGVTTPPTDQAFLSRQQLINLTQSLSISQDALQYLGTFERALEQPSFAPDSKRPRIIGSSAPPPADGTTTNPTPNADSYQGNNDGWGGDDAINPSFLSIRATSVFTRWNGTTAVVGEPLVKTKFALTHLALIAYNATTATIKAASSTSSDPDPALDRFGLTRTSTSSPWIYNHGQGSIMTLSQVAAAGREPDIAELLKAAITVGSLAKGGPNLHPNGASLYQYTVDTAVDYQVLQIMANLIDQQDADSYPTQIQMGTNAGQIFTGDEDLPYFYRYHLFSVVTQLPSPLLATGDAVTFAAPSTGTTTVTTPGNSTPYTLTVSGTSTATGNHIKLGTLTSSGTAVYMYIPDIWNPHDPNNHITSTTNRPALYRLVASTDDPLAATPAWSMAAMSQPSISTAVLDQAHFPTSASGTLTATTSTLQFSDDTGLAFREPTLLWRSNAPTGVNLTAIGSAVGPVTDINTSQKYYGIIGGTAPISTQATFASTTSQATDGTYVIQGTSITSSANLPPGAYQQITFTLQYQDAYGNWIPYDVKYPDLHGMNPPTLIVNTADFTTNTSWENPLLNNQFSDTASGFDPRSGRFGVGTESSLGNMAASSVYLLEPSASGWMATNNSTNNGHMETDTFTVLETNRPRADAGNKVNYSNPGMTSDPGQNVQMRWFSGTGFSASNGGQYDSTTPSEFDGMLSQNNPNVSLLARDGATLVHLYYEDADGVARRAMGAYATMVSSATPMTVSDKVSDSVNTDKVGLPMVTANTFSSDNGIGSYVAAAGYQVQSRPLVLNRPFRNVAEMSYAFRGTPWKNIDFFTPESGDSVMLDTFCINEPPASAMVAGKVDLNTRQAPVLKTIVSGAYYDETANAYSDAGSAGPSYTLSPITATEAGKVAAKLVGITTDTTDGWRGPLPNISSLVGRYVASPGTIGANTDLYSFTETVTGSTSVYAGLSAALDSTVLTSGISNSGNKIQRFREAAIRPLADAGQVRVWNLLIDVVVQTGRYPTTATGLDQFAVDGEKRIWLHVAIDRLTGTVLDKQVEVVAQ